MAQYTITLSDSAAHGIRWMRRKFNAALTLEKDQKLEEHPDYLADDTAYVQMVMSKASLGYVRDIPTVTRRQVFAGLKAGGLYDSVAALVAASSAEVQEEWAVADVFLRSNAMLNAMWPMLPQNAGKPQEQLDAELDDLFATFATL